MFIFRAFSTFKNIRDIQQNPHGAVGDFSWALVKGYFILAWLFLGLLLGVSLFLGLYIGFGFFKFFSLVLLVPIFFSIFFYRKLKIIFKRVSSTVVDVGVAQSKKVITILPKEAQEIGKRILNTNNHANYE